MAGIATIREEPEFVRLRPYLSACLRQASERGEVVEVRHDNWKTLAEGHAHTRVSRKLDLLLKLFCDRSVTVGKAVALDPDDVVLFDAADGGEMNYLTEALREQQLIQAHGPVGSYVVTPKGWERLSPIDSGGVPGTTETDAALVDSLVLLRNRRAFDEDGPRLIAAAHAAGLPLALVRLDVDHFKQVNDEHGRHAIGDEALKAIADIAKACAESKGTAYRREA